MGSSPTWWDEILMYEKGLGKTLASLALVVVAMVLSHLQHLRLEKDMAISIARAFLQLSLIGFVLNFIFSQEGLRGYASIFAAFCIMVLIAGITAGQRAHRVPKSSHVASAAIFFGCALTLALLMVLSIFEPTPRFLIPLSGMMVGNAMSVTGVALKRFHEDLRQNANNVEAALALGASPRQAIVKQLRRSLTVALAPVLDNTKTVGLISLPGAMTGLIMGGASPFEATRLQIIVMCMLIGCSTFSSIWAVFLAWPLYFTPAYQIDSKLLLDDD